MTVSTLLAQKLNTASNLQTAFLSVANSNPLRMLDIKPLLTPQLNNWQQAYMDQGGPSNFVPDLSMLPAGFDIAYLQRYMNGNYLKGYVAIQRVWSY